VSANTLVTPTRTIGHSSSTTTRVGAFPGTAGMVSADRPRAAEVGHRSHPALGRPTYD